MEILETYKIKSKKDIFGRTYSPIPKYGKKPEKEEKKQESSGKEFKTNKKP